MNLLLIVIVSFQATLSQSLNKIVGYVGETVTLPSGVSESSLLQVIEWSILSNTTFIATNHNNISSTNWFHQYNNRLRLNALGDLSINNLRREDAMVYKVEVQQGQNNYKREIQLDIRELLRSPTIEVVYSGFKNNTRWLLLRCSSLHKGVAFRWEASTVTTTFGKRNEKCLAEYNTTQVSAQFTCITTRDTDNASAVYQDDFARENQSNPDIEIKKLDPSRSSSFAIFYLIIFFVTCVVTGFLMYRKTHCNQETATASETAPTAGAVS